MQKEKKESEQTEVIRLTVKEAMETKELWKEIFHEDSDIFTEYYYKEKMPENVAFGIKTEGKLTAMLFLTPYKGRMIQEADTFSICYIVGVGTKKEFRHRGYMDKLLTGALNFLYKEGQPFTFLMPVDPAIYRPYQFIYIYERSLFQVKKVRELTAVPASEADMEELADFSNNWLEKHVQCFLKRDREYFLRQKKELQSQNGDLYLWKTKEGKLAGYYELAKEEDNEEIQEAVLIEKYRKTGALTISEEKEPVIMGRITNVEKMLGMMRLTSSAFFETKMTLQVEDSLIPENSGIYAWKVGKESACAVKLTGENSKADASASITDLENFLFGKADVLECFSFMEGKKLLTLSKLKKVEPITDLFLNEIV